MMPGRRRCRCVGFQPQYLYFEPGFGVKREERTSSSDVEENVLKVEELESIRLKDYLRLNQEEAAERMGVSQPTFHRILSEAHRKIAEAFIEGKVIRIEGGDYMIIHEEHVPPPEMMPCCWRKGGYRRGEML